MDLNLSISNRQIKPSVVNLFQYENQTTTLTFTLDSYMYDQVNLSNYKAYAVTSINGQIDMTELGMSLVDGVLKLTWTLGEYSLSQSGALQYQIVFKENADDGENSAVFYSYKAVIIVRESVDADDHITANYPTLLKQWADRMSNLSSVLETGDSIIYMPVGESIDVQTRVTGKLYYQIENTTTNEGHFEDHDGNRIGEFNAKHITNPDFNTMLTHGEYFCMGSLNNQLNSPITCTVAFLHVTDSGSASQQLQTFYGFKDNKIRTFVRSVWDNGAEFGTWQELATKNLGTANAAVITDANGDLTASSVVSVAELNYLNGVTSNIQTQLNNAGADLTEHSDDTTAHITESERTTWNGKAPTSHASSATTYGVGNAANYGHLKLSDSTSSTSAATAGIAATPAAVKAAYDLANAKQAAITGAASTITDSNLTANMVMITDANGKAAASPYITATELNALNGFVTGGGTVQAQINDAKNKIWMPDYSKGNGTVITSGATVPVNAIGQALLTVDADSPTATVSVVSTVVGSLYHADGLTKVNVQFLIPAGSVVKTVGTVTVRYYPLI